MLIVSSTTIFSLNVDLDWSIGMNFVFGIFKFFKMPIQIAVGLYLALVMLITTAIGFAYLAEDIDYCNEFKFAVSAKNLSSDIQKL